MRVAKLERSGFVITNSTISIPNHFGKYTSSTRKESQFVTPIGLKPEGERLWQFLRSDKKNPRNRNPFRPEEGLVLNFMGE